MTEIKIKTTDETSNDVSSVDDAMAELAVTILVVVSRLNTLYESIHPAIVWNESASVKEAMRISAAIKTVIDNLNTEGLSDDILDREINRLDNLYNSVRPAIVWHENNATREARRTSEEIKFIKNKLIDVKKLIREIDECYDENETE